MRLVLALFAIAAAATAASAGTVPPDAGSHRRAIDRFECDIFCGIIRIQLQAGNFLNATGM
jgi:hypothetical protein